MPLYSISVTNDKNAVVLDIGAAYTKLGFCGEFAPRCIIPTEVLSKNSGKPKRIFDYSTKEELYDLLVDFVNVLYYKYALLSPKDRPVVIVESLLCPTLFRETLAKVLFNHYEVSSMLILPSHLVCLSTLYIDTALVLDVGYSEAVAFPVCHGMPIVHAWQAQPLAAHAIHSSIKTMLVSENIGVKDVKDSTIEDIKVRCCFVTTRERLESKGSQNFKPCPSVSYPLEGDRVVNVSGKLRELSCEILFEEDNDYCSIPSMILDAILKCNIDLRQKLADNILLVGGTTMLPGFKARLKEELTRKLKSERYSKLKIQGFKFHTAPSKENYTAWLGGAIYASTEILTMKALTREKYFKDKKLPDWCVIKEDNHCL